VSGALGGLWSCVDAVGESSANFLKIGTEGILWCDDRLDREAETGR
jgi:hypothetical protein